MAAAEAAVDPVLMNVSVLLGAAVVAVPLAKRLGLGSVLGYLAAGSLIGPYALGYFYEAETVLHVAEFGVVLLLFVIGLELKPSRLWKMRREIFGLGIAQVGLSGVAIAGLLLAVTEIAEGGGSLSWQAAVSMGAALALSSTAFATQLMRDRGELTSRHGDRAFAILLMQDMAIVPILAMVALLAPYGNGESLGLVSALEGLAAIAAVVAVGRYGLRPLFGLIARTGADEIFTAAALLVVAAAALLMQAVGLSMALGAFLAGVLLSESEFRHQLETDIEPFRGLLLGLFFLGVGMTLDWPQVLENWWIVLGGALALYLVKAGILYLLTRPSGSPYEDAVRIAAILGQGGEFGFVILSVGRQNALWAGETESLVAAVVTVTMAMTPLAVWLADLAARYGELDDLPGEDDPEELEVRQIIVAGFGRFGQVIARIMRLRGYEVTLIDNDPRRIQIARSFGNKVFFGDLRRGDILRTAGAERARAIFLCGDDADATERAIEIVRERLPEVLIFARAVDRFDELRLRERGANGVVRETRESAIRLAADALEVLGDKDRVDDILDEFRRRDAELLRLQSKYGAREGLEKLREQFSLDEQW